MAANTRKLFAGPAHRVDVMHNILMTFPTGVLRHALTARLHVNGIVETAGGKGERMKKTVIRFSEIFPDNIARRVAIVAGSDRAMAGFDPAIEMVLHDMAIGACSRIIAQIRRAFCINESVSAEAHRASHH